MVLTINGILTMLDSITLIALLCNTIGMTSLFWCLIRMAISKLRKASKPLEQQRRESLYNFLLLGIAIPTLVVGLVISIMNIMRLPHIHM